jgi:CIC family chloride channel protein
MANRAHLRKLQPEREDPREHGRPARVGVGVAAKASLQTGETPVLPAICNFRRCALANPEGFGQNGRMSGKHPRREVDFIPEDFPQGIRAAVVLIAGAALVGALTGVIGTAFLISLKAGSGWFADIRSVLTGWPPLLGWLTLTSLVTVATMLAAWLVRRFAPNAGGSGIPDVEKVLRGTEGPHHARVLPVKFFGGWLALSCGLLLGREGPTVQMGAVIGERVGRFFPHLQGAWKSLMAAGSGAGLATAFNAPVGGTIFILEEVFRKITPLTFILAATAASVSIFLQRAVFHMPQDYAVPIIPGAPSLAAGLFFAFGAGVGFLGVLYNRLLLRLLKFSKGLGERGTRMKVVAIGAVMGTLAWFAPTWVGGGDDITQTVLAGHPELLMLAAMAVARFFLGPVCYSAGTPGGLFAPVVAMGALVGAVAGSFLHALTPDLVPSPLAFAVAGMAAFFTASVRAPLTGIVICLEMTGCYGLFFPMLATCLGAYLVPTLLKDRPIYDALADLSAKSNPRG